MYVSQASDLCGCFAKSSLERVAEFLVDAVVFLIFLVSNLAWVLCRAAICVNCLVG